MKIPTMSLTLVHFLTLLSIAGIWTAVGAESVGVCYGVYGDNLPPAREVVYMYRKNGISKMRIYSPDPAIMDALRWSGIELVLDVPDDQIEQLATYPSVAAAWVQNNVLRYSPAVSFRYIVVGNEVMPEYPVSQFVAPAMENLQRAISEAGLAGKIKVSTASFTALLGVSDPPSAGQFRDDAKSFMQSVVDFLVQHNSPLLVNIYPYFAYIGDTRDIPVGHALFESSPEISAHQSRGVYEYWNLFDAMLDAHYAALEKLGGGSIRIVVSETGWPSEGNYPAASLKNAGSYYKSLIQHVNSGVGTPRRPDRAIETYLFAMFDEDGKPGAETEKHFGLFRPNKQPKYFINSFR